MSNKIVFKRSAVAGKIPALGDLALGEIALNTYDGKAYIKQDNGTQSIIQLGSTAADLGVTSDTFVGTGSQTLFTLSRSPTTAEYTFITINGLIQESSTYSVSNTLLTFSVAPDLADSIEVRILYGNSASISLRDYKKYIFNITTTTTTVSGTDNNGLTLTYDSGYADVYQNGIRLVDGDDFVANTGTSIVLTSAAVNTDTIEVLSYGRAYLMSASGLAAFDAANSASLYANTGINNAASASLYANNGIANAASASLYANTGINNAASASSYANTGINNAASASLYANTKVSKSGDTITGPIIISDTGSGALQVAGTVTISKDLNVSGNIFLGGSTTTISSNNTVISDPLIYLADGNIANTADIGIVGNVTNGHYYHTGLVRDHLDGTWKFFSNVTSEPTTTVNFGEANTVYDVIRVGGIVSPTALINGRELGAYTQLAYDTANTGISNASSASLYANTGINNAASASSYANTGINNAASASAYANTAINTIPSQTGNSGNILTTNGTTASWSPVNADPMGTAIAMAIALG